MLKYLTFRLAAAIAQRLPLTFAYALACPVASLAYLLYRPGRAAARDNMRHVLGPDASPRVVDAEARRVFRNVLWYYVDLLRMPCVDPARLDRGRLIAHGFEELERAIAQGRGVIVCSAHFGNPELVLQGVLNRGVRVLAVTEPLQPPALSRFVDALRSAPGHRFGPANYRTLKEALRTLRAGGVVAVMFDRDIQGKSIVIDVCGAPAAVPIGAVELAMRTGAMIAPVFSVRRPDHRFDVWVAPPYAPIRKADAAADVRANIEALFDEFTPHLRAHPGQWIVLERVWEGLP